MKLGKGARPSPGAATRSYSTASNCNRPLDKATPQNTTTEPRLRRSAFTLVEVILAILIISAIITVLLYFYQRASELRQNVMREAEFLSVSRMFLEQVSSELRTARVVEDQFIGMEGSSNSITFVCTSIPQMARWIVSTNETVILPPATDLKRVTYSLMMGTNLIDARGVDRTEELLVGASYAAGANSTSLNMTNTTSLVESNLVMTNEFQLIRPPVTDKIRYLQFRYWSGTNWIDSWSGLDLPAAVEITIGHDPMPAETTTISTSSSGSPDTSDDEALGSTGAGEYPYEFFRRVVFLPNSRPTTISTNQVPGEPSVSATGAAFPAL
jgi:type II secretory pathway pseudopilin PulG